MPGEGTGDGWSIHVPSTGFRTEQVEGDGEPAALPPSARPLRLVVRDAEGHPSDGAA